MSDSTPAPEPHPFEKFRDFARKIIAVPKAEADEQERKWREERAKATAQKEREVQP
jgi:hypothetical protein